MNVSSTKDDSAAFTIAQILRGDLGGLQAVSSSLNRAKSVTDVAVAGAEQISDVVNEMKKKAYEAADAGIDTASRAAINKDFVALRDRITTIVNSSEFNGTNLLKTGGGTVWQHGRELALQVKQQLGIQGLSIANQAPQAIMSLFR